MMPLVVEKVAQAGRPEQKQESLRAREGERLEMHLLKRKLQKRLGNGKDDGRVQLRGRARVEPPDHPPIRVARDPEQCEKTQKAAQGRMENKKRPPFEPGSSMPPTMGASAVARAMPDGAACRELYG